MKVIADLHLHSKYSRAVSQQMEPLIMAQWAEKKGINLLASGDWTHPLWLKELEASFKEAEEGIYKLNDKVKFILSTEISSIYSQGGRLRRIHNVVIIPSFKIAHKINQKLKSQGCKLMSDGRPIIGLSSIQLAELIWSIEESCLIIPAHIWTPWFSMFGSKSGFDSLKECWGEYQDRIYAIETGLSSDPAMNWRIKELENRSIISFSDAHSPPKLGREATIFESQSKNKSFNYQDLVAALRQDKNSNWQIAYTIEFHPEEGKYHYSGHRNCEIRHSPEETKKRGTTCPVCGKQLTLGVMHRVEELAHRPAINPLKKENKAGLVGYYNPRNKKRPPYVMLVPLMEILAETFKTGSTSQKVINEYNNLTKNLAPEFEILTQTNNQEIERFSSPQVAAAIKKVRQGDIIIEPGFDGLFGKVKIWPEDDGSLLSEAGKNREQMSLF